MKLALALLAAAVVAAAAVALNLVLLGSASGNSDPVGNLKPLANMPQAPPAPKWTLRPATTTTDADEHRGRGRGSDD